MPYKREGNRVLRIDWDEFKEFKKTSVRSDNFEILLEFIKSYYHIVLPQDVYDMLRADDTAQMMLDKRSIKDAVALENYLYKL